MTGFVGDLRYGLRGLVRNRGFAAAAVLSLALGIGANTTIFTLLNAVFLRPIPVHDSATLAALVTVDAHTPGQFGLSYPNYRDLRDRNTVFSSLTLYSPVTASLTGQGDPQLLMIHLVTGDYFGSLGIRMALGRGFLAEEDAPPEGLPVAVLSYPLWMRLYGGDPSVTARSIEIDGRPYRIVGVAPPGFAGLNQMAGADVFLPFSGFARVVPAPALVGMRRALLFSVVARLKPGFSRRQAEEQLAPLVADLARAYPEDNRDRRVRLLSLEDAAMDARARPLISRSGAVLLAIAALVLLIACGNVANLLLARASGRNREIAIRLALGAGRQRLVRQLLAESAVLSLAGGACGLQFARWSRDLLWGMRPPVFRHAAFTLDLDSRVLLFTLAVSLLTGLVFGLVPALRATNPDLAGDLKERGSASGGIRRVTSVRSMLVIAQVALSLVALVGAGLFLRSLQNAALIDVGFDAAHLGVVAYNVADQSYSEDRGRDFHTRVLERAAAVPGVAAAAVSKDTPFRVSAIRTVQLAGEEGQAGHPTLTSVVSPGYFQAVRIPLLRGRDFTATDSKAAPRVVIVNEAAAAVLWPGQDPIGKRLTFAGEGIPVEVVGVARNANYMDVAEPPRPLVYLSLVQYYFPAAVLYIRTAGDPAETLASVKRAVQSLDPKLVLQTETLAVSMRELLWVQRLAAGLLAAFGALATLLSTLGIYGVISYSVHQRTREIGIRVALGASPAEVRAMILREGIRLVAVGVLIGAVLSLSLAGSVSGLLFLHNARDLTTFTLVPSLLVLVGTLACWAPAFRATRVDPSSALRDE
ncbi:MAG: ABC transporter permease [Acidobacteriota bacterium]|nr:ABC transporter permease [Acidobacteriota bacterium]